jgi:hypothetical protein
MVSVSKLTSASEKLPSRTFQIKSIFENATIISTPVLDVDVDDPTIIRTGILGSIGHPETFFPRCSIRGLDDDFSSNVCAGPGGNPIYCTPPKAAFLSLGSLNF